ncbi:MAG: hypothetical protein ABSD03_11020 [Vulcanimicrobiaceae bacterium]
MIAKDLRFAGERIELLSSVVIGDRSAAALLEEAAAALESASDRTWAAAKIGTVLDACGAAFDLAAALRLAGHHREAAKVQRLIDAARELCVHVCAPEPLTPVRQHLSEVGRAFELLVPQLIPDAISCRFRMEAADSGDSFVSDDCRAKFVVQVDRGGKVYKLGLMLELANDFDAVVDPQLVARAIISEFKGDGCAIESGEAPPGFRYPSVASACL